MPQTEIERKKILIVDDELDIRIFLCNLLATRGFEPIDAGNGSEGLKKAREEKPALIILDVMMPKEGGILAYCELKNDEELREIPVIMISSLDKKTFFHCQKFQRVQRDKALPRPSAYLEKPLEADKLIRLVRMLTKTDEKHGSRDG